MPILSKPSSADRAAVLYVTLGTLMDVWSGVWLYYLNNHPPERDSLYYWAWCFLLTGFALLVIGLAVGRIGRSARHAELPPEEVTAASAQAELTAAARAPMIAPVNPAVPVNGAIPVNGAARAIAPMAAVVPSAATAAPVATIAKQ